MTRLELAKHGLQEVSELVDKAIMALDDGNPRNAAQHVYDARNALGAVKTTLSEELQLVRLRLEAEETARLKRAKIGGRP